MGFDFSQFLMDLTSLFGPFLEALYALFGGLFDLFGGLFGSIGQ